MRYYTAKNHESGWRRPEVPCSSSGACQRRPVAARSAFMRSEEIDRERAMSGWNPYYGEEEDTMPEQTMPRTTERTTEIMQPYFMQPDYAQVLEEQKMAERDLRMLQSMYPEAAKLLLPYIEEECDKMEYEGSTMYDEYPDPTTILRLEQRIYEQTRDQLPEVMVQTEQTPGQEDILSMQYQGNRRGRGGRSWPNDLIRILLLQEMYHRRCRHRGCRRGRL